MVERLHGKLSLNNKKLFLEKNKIKNMNLKWEKENKIGGLKIFRLET